MATASERLAAWRTLAGLSQREAAKRAGVAQPTWSDLESGRAKRVSVDTALLVEKITEGAIRVTEWSSADADATGPQPVVSTESADDIKRAAGS